MSYPWLEEVEREFAERLQGGRLAHALLLSGPQDCGKVELAKKFLASVLCLEDSYPACGHCRSCQLMASGAHPDGHTITFEEHPKTGELRKELVIGQIRQLTRALFLTNTFSRRKAALVYPVEAMNLNTANALLKTLEEPTGETVMLLVSHDPARLPATIRSRCQDLHLRLPEPQAALRWVSARTGSDADRAALALEAAAGSPLRAERMLNDGGIDEYIEVNGTLDGLLAGSCSMARALSVLGGIDPVRLWSWVSLRAAALARRAAEQGGDMRLMVELQGQADRNRRLSATPVRKDLLLQDWLLQWGGLNA